MRKILNILITFLPLFVAGTAFNTLPISAQKDPMGSATDDITNMTTSINTNNLTLPNSTQANETKTSSVKTSMFNMVNSKINISLSQAADIAEDFVDSNSSRAVMSQLDKYNGYLVYVVCILDPSMNLTHVYVDPGNGKIVSTKAASINEARMMHGNVFVS